MYRTAEQTIGHDRRSQPCNGRQQARRLRGHADLYRRIATAVAGALLVLALDIAAAAPPEAPRGVPGEHGVDPGRLARIDARMRKALESGMMVGGHGIIARHGRVVYDATWGLADREAGRPIEADTLYRIYSMSKPITSVALLMLYEEGHFLLEDPVASYLPELAGLSLLQEQADGTTVSVDPQRQPTIRDLLRHTAGFTYGVFGDSAVDRLYRENALFDAPTLADFTQRLGGLPLRFDPGSRWHYSVAVDVQGRLIEAISGMSFGEFLRTRVFEPLGMHDTYFVIPKARRARLAQLYTPLGTSVDWRSPWRFTDETRLVVADPELTRPYLNGHLFESGGAGLISTTSDYLRFALMLAGDGAYGSVRLLSPRTVELLRSNHIAGLDSTALRGMGGFGLGVGIIGQPSGVHGELAGASAYGWAGAAGTLFWVDPEADLAAVFMVQSVPHQTPLSKVFRVLTYQALLD